MMFSGLSRFAAPIGSMLLTASMLLLFATASPNACADQPSAGKQVAMEVEVDRAASDGNKEKAKVRFWLFLPEGYKADEAKKWPLMLFLHGSGERGDVLDKVKVHGPPKIVAAEPSKIAMIVISPQCESGKRWDSAELVQLVDQMAKKFNADPKRLYLTGLSMGGYGTWNILADYPGKFAAAVPVCGGGNPTQVEKMKATPIWVFHGAKDQAVKLERSEEMVNALQKIQGDVKLTVYPEAGHDSWTETYANPEVYKWLLEKSL